MKDKKSMTPVLTTLGCLGIAATTSIAGSVATAGSIGLAGKIIIDLLGGLSVNVASSQLERIDAKALRGWWTGSGTDISNHDLYKTLRQSLILAVQATEKNYLSQFGLKSNKYHLENIKKKVALLCEYVENNFDEVFKDSISDQNILSFEEGYDDSLFLEFQVFLNEGEENFGEEFFLFLKEQLPLNILAAFSEILKTNKRAWVAYQRLLLIDIKHSQGRLELGLNDVLEKIDSLANQINTIDACSNLGDSDHMAFIWNQFEEARDYYSFSINKIDSYQEDFSIQLQRLQKDISEEIIEQRAYREDSMEALYEIKERLEKGLGNIDIDDLEKNTLPVYLNWLVQEFQTISLPAIQEKKSKQTIPLERVYVALQLTDEKTRENFQYGSKLIKQQIKEEEAKSGRRLSEDERSIIRANVLQQNRTLSSFNNSKLESNKQFNTAQENNGTVSLSQVFQNERHLLILGDPGSGKSTLAKYLTLQLAKHKIQGAENVTVSAEKIFGKSHDNPTEEELIDLGPARLPILIKIPEYTKFFEEYQFNPQNASSGKGIIDFCGFHIPTIPNLDPLKLQQLIKHYLIKKEVVFFLDGMDEVVKNRVTIINEIEKFINFWIDLDGQNNDDDSPMNIGGNQIVITSRIVGYHAAPLRSAVTQVYVREMDRMAIESFCDLWTQQVLKEELAQLPEEEKNQIIEKEAKGLKDAIFDDNKPRIRDLATNPLLVTILSLLYRYQNNELPKSRVELYEQTIGILTSKWKEIHQDNDSITPTELNALLESLAGHIHSSPSEEITEMKMSEILEDELKLLREYRLDEITPMSIKHHVGKFIRIIREDVGLLSERGEKLYHFLHRTFQEYLAGRKLVADPSTAIHNIVERLSDPVWREPVLLSIAYTNKYWSPDRFNQLLHSLLSAEDNLKDLIPRGILLIASSLPDMEKITPSLFKSLVQGFLEAFGDRNGIGRFKPIRNAIKTIIDNLRTSDKKDAFYDACFELLKESEYGNVQWALISLSATDNWYDEKWVEHIFEHQSEDSFDWDWPIDLLLHKEFSKDEQNQKYDFLYFREKLITQTEYFEHIQSDVDWMRLIMVLYGGWKNNPLVEEYKEFETMRYQLGTHQVDMENEGYQFAVRLDTELGKFKELKNNPYDFNPKFIHRESPFTRVLLRYIGAKEKGRELVPLFYDIWREEESIDTQALALLALAALGENVAKLIYEIDDNSDHYKGAIRFLDHLKRLERNLSVPFFRLTIDAKSSKNLQEIGWKNIPTHQNSHIWSLFCKTAYSFGFTSPHSFPSISESQKRIYPNEKELVAKDWPHFVLREAESYAAIVGMVSDDPVYAVSVLLDTCGKYLSAENGKYILDAICELPYTSILNSPFSFNWKMPSHFMHPKDDFEKLILAIRIIDGLPDDYNFLKEFFISALWNKMESNPDLRSFALSIFINKNYSSLIQNLVLSHYGAGDLTDYALSSLEQINHSYIRFLTARNINRHISSFISERILLKSLGNIDQAENWIEAFMLTQQRETLVLILFNNDETIQYIGDLNKLISGEHPEELIRTKSADIKTVTNQIRAKFFAAELVSEEDKKKLVFEAMDLIPDLLNDEEKSRSLKLILEKYQPIATKYPSWEMINKSFSSPYWLNRALSKEYNNLIDLHEPISQQTEDTATTKSSWSVFTLMCMTQELHDRFQQRDIDGILVKNILNKKEAEISLRNLLNRNKTGLPLNNRYVNFIDQLFEQQRIDTIQVLLPLIELKDIGELQWIKHWANHECKDLAIFSNLIRAETGLINPEILDSLIEIIKHHPDRLKYRAAIAIHGQSPNSANEYRTHSSQKLGFDFLYHLKSVTNKIEITNPSIGSILCWFNHNYTFDSPEFISKLVAIHLAGKKEEQKIVHRILTSIERTNQKVIHEIFNSLKVTVPSTGCELWEALGKLSYNDNIRIHKDLVTQELITAAIKDESSVNALLFLEEDYQLSSISIVGESLLSIKESTSDLESRLDQAILEAKSLGKLNFSKYIPDPKALKKELIRLGSNHYYSESGVKSECERVANLIGNNTDLIKILIKWTFNQLEEDLINRPKVKLAGDLCMLLAKVASNYSEVFQSIVNKKTALRILPETIKYHYSYTARNGAIELLSHLKSINPIIVDSIVNALTDIDIVRQKAIESLPNYSEVVNKKTISKINKYLDGKSAQVSNEVAKLLANISSQAALDTDLRKVAINTIADSLRDQLNIATKKKSIYNIKIENSNGFSLKSSISHEGELEDTLYEELVRLAGL